MDGNIRYDSVKLRAEITPEGYLRDTPVIGRAGIQEYRRADGTVRREYRPPEVVFSPEALAGVQGIPIIDTHIGMMRADNVRQHAIGSVLSAARQDGENMISDIVIYDPSPVTKHGRKELSLAYAVRCDENPGTTPNGEPYDAKVIAITRYNHLAIVERGRAGTARLRLDSEDAISTDIADVEFVNKEDEDNMSAAQGGGNAPQNGQTGNGASQNGGRSMVSIRVDGLEYPAAPEVERFIARLNADLTAANKRADTAEAARDTMQQTISGHAAEIERVRADTAETMRNRWALESVAREHGVELRADASDRAIREDIIRKINNDAAMRFDGKSEDYVIAVMDMAIENAKKTQRQNNDNRATVFAGTASRTDGAAPAGMPTAPAINSAAAARVKMLSRNRL